MTAGGPHLNRYTIADGQLRVREHALGVHSDEQVAYQAVVLSAHSAAP